MDNTAIMSLLEELANTLGIQIRYEHLEGESTFSSGGLCRIMNKDIIIVNSMATTKEKVQTLAKALRRFDLSQIYLKPALRDFLENITEKEKPILKT